MSDLQEEAAVGPAHPLRSGRRMADEGAHPSAEGDHRAVEFRARGRTEPEGEHAPYLLLRVRLSARRCRVRAACAGGAACRTLRGMSLQASNLRYGHKALELADSAAEAAPDAGPRLVAFLRGQQAHASSMVGDRHRAFERLREAEAALSRADSRRESIGGYDQAAYQFHVAHVLYETRDLPGSIAALKTSLRVQPRQERQGRLHANAVMAQRQFEFGHIEEACTTWGTFLDDYVGLSSARGDEHFATMRKRIAPYGKLRAARELQERSRQVAGMKG